MTTSTSEKARLKNSDSDDNSHQMCKKKCHLETLFGNLITSVQTKTSGAKSKETRSDSKRDIILINNLEEIILT